MKNFLSKNNLSGTIANDCERSRTFVNDNEQRTFVNVQERERSQNKVLKGGYCMLFNIKKFSRL
jgi:hypothetical protein